MASLLDIAPLTETVSVNGKDVDVFGVSAQGVVNLIARFPEARKMMAGREVDIEKLLAMGGEAVAALIAAGAGMPGNPKAEEMAGRLPLDVQIDFLAKILKLTLPNGIAALGEKLAALGAAAGVEAGALPKAPDTK